MIINDNFIVTVKYGKPFDTAAQIIKKKSREHQPIIQNTGKTDSVLQPTLI
jgi:hypothetical protein